MLQRWGCPGGLQAAACPVLVAQPCEDVKPDLSMPPHVYRPHAHHEHDPAARGAHVSPCWPGAEDLGPAMDTESFDHFSMPAQGTAPSRSQQPAAPITSASPAPSAQAEASLLRSSDIDRPLEPATAASSPPAKKHRPRHMPVFPAPDPRFRNPILVANPHQQPAIKEPAVTFRGFNVSVARPAGDALSSQAHPVTQAPSLPASPYSRDAGPSGRGPGSSAFSRGRGRGRHRALGRVHDPAAATATADAHATPGAGAGVALISGLMSIGTGLLVLQPAGGQANAALRPAHVQFHAAAARWSGAGMPGSTSRQPATGAAAFGSIGRLIACAECGSVGLALTGLNARQCT